MECFAFGLGVGHQNSNDQWLDTYYPKALCRPDPDVVSIIADVFDWDGSNLTRQIAADDLDDLLEALEDSNDGDAEGLLKALLPLAGTERTSLGPAKAQLMPKNSPMHRRARGRMARF